MERNDVEAQEEEKRRKLEECYNKKQKKTKIEFIKWG